MLIISFNPAAAEQKAPSRAQQFSHDLLVSAHTRRRRFVLLISGVIQGDHFHSFSRECSKLQQLCFVVLLPFPLLRMHKPEASPWPELFTL